MPFSATRYRDALALLIPLASMLWVLSIPQRLGWLIFPEQILAAMLGIAMAVVYLRDIDTPGASWNRSVAVALATLSLLAAIYLAVRIPVLSEEAFFRPVETLLVSVVLLPLIIEAMRRSVGWSLVIVFALFALYALLGDLIPGKMQARALAPDELLRFLGTDTTAMLGLPLAVTCFVVVMFILFGRVLQTTGGSAFFTGLSQSLAGSGPAGPARVSIIASSLFGSISGSAVSNVMSTGVVTIPLMKKAAMPAHRAAAIESVASTGGQLMPPVMGAAAFLMAEFLQLPYRDILLAALIPAMLYYLALFLQVDFLARRDSKNAVQDTGSAETSVRQVLLAGWILPIPFAVLIIALFAYNLSPEYSVLYALAALIVLSLFRRDAQQRMTPRKLLADLIATGHSVAELLLITAVAGMIIGILSNTGLSFSLGFVLLGFGEQSLFALLLLTALVCIILGMGLPTTGVYLLLATLAAPPLVDLGLAPIQAHLFVLYFGMLSMITPPVAIAAFAAASLAGSPQMRTGFEAVRLGWCAYLVPFLFIYHPSLLMQGSAVSILLTLGCVFAALLLCSGAIAGHGLSAVNLPARIAAIVVAVPLLWVYADAFHPLRLLALLAALLMMGWHISRSSQRRSPAGRRP